MFLSAQALAIEYGIDDRIAKFFVDREPPKNNLYWKDKLLYLRPLPGYIFIPLIADLYFRSGVSLKMLLGESFVTLVEDVLHLAAEQEAGLLSYQEMEQRCVQLVQQKPHNADQLSVLLDYFKGGDNNVSRLASPFRALRRGDVFLFSLCVLEINEAQFLSLAKTWFALISVLLLMDDSEDYLADLASGDENVFIESGSNQEGFDRIKTMLSSYLRHIEAINYSMAQVLHKKVISIPEKPGINEFLK